MLNTLVAVLTSVSRNMSPCTCGHFIVMHWLRVVQRMLRDVLLLTATDDDAGLCPVSLHFINLDLDSATIKVFCKH